MPFSNPLRIAAIILKDTLVYLVTRPPAHVFYSYLTSWSKFTQFREKHYAVELSIFRELTSSGLAITQDWFTHNIPLWNWALSKHLQIEAPLRVLEIGSFEGLSTRFLLSKLPSSQITCVDTFSGSLEHKGDDDKGFIDFDLVKGRFDHNTSGFESRLTVERRTSLEFLASLDPAELFDMVYIDGSHEADDVLLDAILSFKHLRPGGLIVFDDYMWEFYPVRADNPGAAINSFLSLKRHELEIVYVGWQVIVKRRQGQRTLGYGAHPRGV